MKSFSWPLCLALCVVIAAQPARAADDVVAAARSAAEKYRKSVVTVKIVIKVKQDAGGQTRDFEQKIEINGTVIDPSGLTVTAANTIDPSAMWKAMGRNIEVEVKETAILLDDGTEVDADVVLKDTDLDLAFIRPREAQKMDAVTLKKRAAPLQPLDEIFAIGRLGKLANRSTSIGLGRVRALVKGPKSFYVCDSDIANNMGCAAFAADGEPVGVFVAKLNQEPPGPNRSREQMIVILRPVEDVLEIAEQAKNAKVPEKKSAEGEKKPEGEKKTAEGEKKE